MDINTVVRLACWGGCIHARVVVHLLASFCNIHELIGLIYEKYCCLANHLNMVSALYSI